MGWTVVGECSYFESFQRWLVKRQKAKKLEICRYLGALGASWAAYVVEAAREVGSIVSQGQRSR